MTATLSPKTLVSRYLEQAVSGRDAAAIRELVSPQVVFTSPYTPEPIRGIDGFAGMIAMLHGAFPDLRIHEHGSIAEGDTVASRWTATGTHKGNFMGHAPTGRAFRISGISVYRVERGCIAEGWVNDDSLGMMMQLGLLPQPQAVS